VPPLRDRRADIPELIDFFVDKVNRTLGTSIVGVTDEARELLIHHAWPGNVRELENTLLRAAVLARGRTLLPDDFSLSGSKPAGWRRKPGPRGRRSAVACGICSRRRARAARSTTRCWPRSSGP
jgi:DNA-binding NtrC family response regulator